MREVLLVGIGGAAGAVARHLLGAWLLTASGQPRFPVGTLGVNLLGCALIGVFAALSERVPGLDGPTRLLVATGVLGGFTTFSAFGLETVILLRRGEPAVALGYVGASVVLGVVAVWLGMRAVEMAR